MRFSHPQACLKYQARIGGDVICGVTSRRHVMIEIEGLYVRQCIHTYHFCEEVSKAIEIFAVLINQYFTKNQIEDKGYLVALTYDNVHIISLTKLTNPQVMEVIQMLLNTLNELEKDEEYKKIVELYDRRYLQMTLERKACTLRYSEKAGKEPPEPLAIIRPGLLKMRLEYRFLYSLVDPLVKNMVIKEKEHLIWP